MVGDRIANAIARDLGTLFGFLSLLELEVQCLIGGALAEDRLGGCLLSRAGCNLDGLFQEAQFEPCILKFLG